MKEDELSRLASLYKKGLASRMEQRRKIELAEQAAEKKFKIFYKGLKKMSAQVVEPELKKLAQLCKQKGFKCTFEPYDEENEFELKCRILHPSEPDDVFVIKITTEKMELGYAIKWQVVIDNNEAGAEEKEYSSFSLDKEVVRDAFMKGFKLFCTAQRDEDY